MSDTITIVSGLGRCGSSLCMDMLIAGGMNHSPLASPPFWEDGRTKYLPEDPSWLYELGHRDLVLKDLNVWLKQPPPDLPYRWIWMDRRDKKAQEKSWDKFVERERLRQNNKRVMRKKLDFKHDRQRFFAIMRRLGGSIMAIYFEDLIEKPLPSAVRLNAFVGGHLDIEAMARCPINRPTSCLPYMLEDMVLRNQDQS